MLGLVLNQKPGYKFKVEVQGHFNLQPGSGTEPLTRWTNCRVDLWSKEYKKYKPAQSSENDEGHEDAAANCCDLNVTQLEVFTLQRFWATRSLCPQNKHLLNVSLFIFYFRKSDLGHACRAVEVKTGGVRGVVTRCELEAASLPESLSSWRWFVPSEEHEGFCSASVNRDPDQIHDGWRTLPACCTSRLLLISCSMKWCFNICFLSSLCFSPCYQVCLFAVSLSFFHLLPQ